MLIARNFTRLHQERVCPPSMKWQWTYGQTLLPCNNNFHTSEARLKNAVFRPLPFTGVGLLGMIDSWSPISFSSPRKVSPTVSTSQLRQRQAYQITAPAKACWLVVK